MIADQRYRLRHTFRGHHDAVRLARSSAHSGDPTATGLWTKQGISKASNISKIATSSASLSDERILTRRIKPLWLSAQRL